MLTYKDLMADDWMRLVNPYFKDLVLQVLWAEDDGVRLKHSVGSDYDRVLKRYDIRSKCDYAEIEQIPLDRSLLERIGFKDDGMYGFMDLGDQKYAKYYHHLHRFEVIWEGMDDRANDTYQRDVIYCATVSTVDELQHAFKSAHINIEIKL